MSRLLIALLILSLPELASCAPTAAVSEPSPDEERAVWGAGIILLCEIAEADHALQARLWSWFPGRMRAILGALKCVKLLLVFTGLLAIAGARRVGRRYL